jgi:hypothetical protein
MKCRFRTKFDSNKSLEPYYLMKTLRLLTIYCCAVLLWACSSGKKAYEKGDYYDAVSKAVARLKQKPDHDKSKETLRNAYPQALQVLEQNAQNILASNDMFKYRNSIQVYNQINQLAELIKSSPAALSVIRTPKNYYTEIGEYKEKASEELYTAGIASMLKATRRDSRQAYFYFKECETFVPRYKEALEMMTQSEKDGTLNVLWEESSYDQWTSSANIIRSLDQIQFVDLVHKNVAVGELDKKTFHLNMLVSILSYNESTPKVTKSEREITDSVKVGEKVVDNVKVPTYQKIKGKYISYEKLIESRGRVAVVLKDPKTGNIVLSQEFEGTGKWSGSWGACSGDDRVFTKAQRQACANGEPSPDKNILRNQAKENVDKAVTARLSSFLRDY